MPTHMPICFLALLLGSYGSGRGVKTSPAQNAQRSLPGSLQGVPAGPPKRVKNESPGNSASLESPVFSEDFSLLVTFLLVTFLWLFRGPHLLGKTVFGPFSWLFCGFFVALVLGKFYAYSP